MTLREVLHAHIPTLTRESTIRDAVDKMDIYQFPALVVVDDDSMPIGTYVDMCENLPLIDPRKVTAPTIIMRGQFDGIAGFEPIDAQELWGNVAVTQAFLTLSEVLGHTDMLIAEGRVQEVVKGEVQARMVGSGVAGQVTVVVVIHGRAQS